MRSSVDLNKEDADDTHNTDKGCNVELPWLRGEEGGAMLKMMLLSFSLRWRARGLGGGGARDSG